jgi:hypothetical protein
MGKSTRNGPFLMANLTFIVDLPIIHGDFPVGKLLVYQRVPSTVENLDH